MPSRATRPPVPTAAAVLLAASLALAASASDQATLVFDFAKDRPGRLPAGFEEALTGEGLPGTWRVTPAGTVVQESADRTSRRFPVLIAAGPPLRDGEVSVRFRALSGEVDQVAGIAFRVQDARNYRVVRANALEKNVRFYRFSDGIRSPTLSNADLDVTPRAWHRLRVSFSGPDVECFYDDTLVFRATDDGPGREGRVGLWTKADAVTEFDDSTVRSK